jgi:hypothetical protein
MQKQSTLLVIRRMHRPSLHLCDARGIANSSFSSAFLSSAGLS